LVSRRHRPATALSWGSPVLRGLMCDRVVSFWTSDTGCATSCSRGRLPDHRSPNRAIRVHSALDLDPLQSSSPPPGRPTRRSDPTPLRFRRPTTTSPGRAPCWSEDVHPRFRFRPQVFTTSRRFHSRPGFAALFRAAAVLGQPLPSEPSLARIAAPLSRPLAPLRSSPRTLRAPSAIFHRGFHRRLRHLWRACRSPPAAMGSLSTDHPWLGGLPVALDRARRTHARPHGSSASKP